jgi:histidyl-tRNA synthetase
MQRGVIAPRTLKGFRDVLPEEETVRLAMLTKVRQSFESFGFRGFDTPALEYAEILLGKGSDESDKQMFRFTDSGGREVGMRFDLTVPLARFVAQHQHDLVFPFRAYHVGSVWRGERPQRGRFREFMQCDADVVGSSSVSTDLEIITMFASTLELLGIGDFTIKVNDRRILSGLLERLELTQISPEILRSLDKRDKIGEKAVFDELAALGVTPSARQVLLQLISPSGAGEPARTLESVIDLAGGNAEVAQVAEEMNQLPAYLESAGVEPSRVIVDPSIVRGLDYYTGLVFETALATDPHIGSIASGGRYDDLAGLYTTTKLPGVGGSIGIDRILASSAGLAQSKRTEPDEKVIVIVHSGSEHSKQRLKLASELRTLGFVVDLYPDPKPHGAQLKYAAARRAGFAITLDNQEAHIRDLQRRESTLVPADEKLAILLSTMAGNPH